jgi:hypothetical protein
MLINSTTILMQTGYFGRSVSDNYEADEKEIL